MGKVNPNGSEFFSAGSRQAVGPNLIIDGPPAPGSYSSTPDRSLVRTADPRIEDQVVPDRTYPGQDSRPGKALLAACEEGTSKY